MSHTNGTNTKSFVSVWDMVLALAMEHGSKKQIHEMAPICVTTENPDG